MPTKSNKFLVELRLILIFIWNKDPEIAKRILKKNQVEGFKDVIYIVINPQYFRHDFDNKGKQLDQ